MIDLNVISNFFETGKQLNLGKHPDTVIVEYGYTYVDNEFILYLIGSNENNDFIENYIVSNKEAHFYKFSTQGSHILGNGFAKILETKEEKINGLKIIKKQQTGNDKELIFDENRLNDLLIVTILVENYHIIKH